MRFMPVIPSLYLCSEKPLLFFDNLVAIFEGTYATGIHAKASTEEESPSEEDSAENIDPSQETEITACSSARSL